MVHIPVVMATDNRYVPLIVSITSMLKNAGEDTFYDIYIMIDDLFTEESMRVVQGSFECWKDRYSLSFKNVGHVFDDVMTRIPHITRPTYYRLIIPELLSENKCIYLDTDTVILSDLQPLFDIPLEECYVAGVWHPGVVVDGWEEGVLMNTGLASADQYINAGVLIMNLETMRRDRVVAQFLELVPQKFSTQDQDIINRVCYGRIKLIPFQYNVMTKMADRSVEEYKGCYSETELREAWNKPDIIHYASPEKPWNSPAGVYIDFWWEYLRKSSVYHMWVKDFVNEFLIYTIYSARNTTIFTKRIPRIFDFSYKRAYVVYGAGKRGKDVITYMKQMGVLPEFIVVSDTEGNPQEVEGIEVKDIKEAGKLLNDKTIVIAVRESWQRAVIKTLQDYDYWELLPVSDQFLQ